LSIDLKKLGEDQGISVKLRWKEAFFCTSCAFLSTPPSGQLYRFEEVMEPFSSATRKEF
jgi:hypothetical protein